MSNKYIICGVDYSNDRCTMYAIDVINGDITAGNSIIKACKRHIRDLEKQCFDDFGFKYDPEKADRIIRFGETLVFTDGEMAGKPVVLIDFQCFILGSLFGWVNKLTGYRRFKKSYVQLARKQAKSILNAIIALYCLEFVNYHNAQIYCVATKRDQAKIVWSQVMKFAKKKKNLRKRFKFYEREGVAKSLKLGGSIVALGRSTDSIDGFEPFLGIVDEYHSHKTNQMVKLLEDGSINLPEYLISIITTAGFDTKVTNPCVIEYSYSKNILDETLTNESYFTFIAELDKDDDPFDEMNWYKACPLLKVIPQALDSLKRLCQEARDKGGTELVNFFTKSINMWYEWRENTFLETAEIKQNASEFTLADMQGKSCSVGIDLAEIDDLTGIAFEFKLNESEYFVHTHAFIPEETYKKRLKDNVPYDLWANKGLVTPTPGLKTDYNFVVQYMLKLQKEYNLDFIGIGYDRHGINTILDDLGAMADTVDIIQSARSLNDSTLDLKMSFKESKYYYNKENQLLEYCFNNAVTESNSFGEIKLDKKKRINKIDICDACVNARKISLTMKPKFKINDAMSKFNDLIDRLGD